MSAKPPIETMPDYLREHHELCLGVLAQCYPHVPPILQAAIREGIEMAITLGLPVSTKNLEKGGPIFSGGNS